MADRRKRRVNGIRGEARRPSPGDLAGLRDRGRVGFTLIEVLLVLAILGVLAAIAIPNLLSRQEQALIRATRITISGVEAAARMYAAEHDGEYPQGNTSAAFGRLLSPPPSHSGNRVRPYLEELPLDAWERPLYYEFPTTKHSSSGKPAIWSSGPNGKNEQGAGDDVANFEV